MATELVEKTPARDTTDDSLLEKDVSFLHPSDHPGMALSSTPMDGTNFLPWTRAVYVSLGAKLKLGFIDGSFPQPAPGSVTFGRWRRVDLMITSWIWNSISKEIVKSFMYTKTARDLWLDLHARYGQSNGPMIYEIHRGIASISQGTLSLTGYFSQFKELWDEIVWLEPPPKCLCGGCSCEISKVILERMEAHQATARTHVLSCTVYRSGIITVKSEEEGTGGKALMANVTKTVDSSPSEQNIGDLVTELLKIVKSTNTPSDPVTTTYANYVHIDEEFAGNASNHFSIDFDYWIIDTGATNHICADITIFTSYAKPSHKHSVHLRDGIQKPVLYVGTVKLSDNFVLDNVLHIPGFSVNLLSVSQLAKSNSVSLTFTQTGCILQDQASRKTLALGTLYEKLYVLNRASFNVVHPSSPPVMSCSVSHCTDVVWHRRLGHASMRVIKQLPIPMTSLVIDPQRAKFHKRALRCILLGYAPNKKAYKLYDLENHHTVMSRDVVFHEDVFLFDTQQSSTTTCHLPIPSTPDTHLDYPIPSTQSTVSSLAPSIQTHVPLSTSGISSPQVPLHVPEAPIVRRSSRTIQKPCWLDDFICHLNYPHLLSSCNAAYISFVASLSMLQEPRSFAEASKSRQWREAMNSKRAALEHNNTWIVTPLPEGKKAIGCKWVYKLKLNADGTVDRHKARLVAKGYNQIERVDYVDCFSPIAKTVTVRVFLAIAAAHNWPIHQLDVNNAFLHGHLEEYIYMLPPEGSSVPPGMVCKLARSLYGLKQASRQWNLEFSSKLALFGFRQSSHDYCLFIKHTELGSLFSWYT
ncbi:UNVERIFIED_CONTAM: Retrovirus-related Pol polyprotein from transposon RE1 [Sesamum radiatum]|uniref:Retrovirus-related Pol polyprotein from transposon RE1 n=1 Tax=Sesamum radiatum TaxID=300843 RepID=A0AAW2S898_SESRA